MKLNKSTLMKLIIELKDAGVAEAKVDSKDFQLSVRFKNDPPSFPQVNEDNPREMLSKDEMLKQYESTLFGVNE